MKKRARLAVVGLLLVGCGAPGRPSGLPSPEYEVPQVEPWPPASAAPVQADAPPTVATPAPVTEGSAAQTEAPLGPPQNVGGSGATLPAGTP